MAKPKPVPHDDCSWIIEWLFDEYVKTFNYDETSTCNVLKQHLWQVVAARNLSQGRKRSADADHDTAELVEILKKVGVIIDENKHFWFVDAERVRELFKTQEDQHEWSDWYTKKKWRHAWGEKPGLEMPPSTFRRSFKEHGDRHPTNNRLARFPVSWLKREGKPTP